MWFSRGCGTGCFWCIVEGMNDVVPGMDNLPRRHSKSSPAIRAEMVDNRRRKGLNDPELHNPHELRRQRDRYKLDSLLVNHNIITRTAMEDDLEKIHQRMKKGNLKNLKGFMVVAGDIATLKYVNDARDSEDRKLGSHITGDKVIVNAGRALSKVFRTSIADKIARIGGDEFLMLIPVNESEFDLDKASVLMNGNKSEGSQGRLAALKKEVEGGMLDIRRIHPYLDNNRAAGMLDIGWDYITREDFMELHDSSIKSETDFPGLLQDLAEVGVASEKGLRRANRFVDRE